MAIYQDEQGRILHRPSVETQGLAGRFFVRREPIGDDSDTVTILGGSSGGTNDFPENLLVVTCARFGAIPEGWNSAVVTADLEEFVANYTEMSPEALEKFNAEQHAESVRVTKAAERAREAARERERQKLAKAIAAAMKEGTDDDAR